jgi:hypothetical protein
VVYSFLIYSLENLQAIRNFLEEGDLKTIG